MLKVEGVVNVPKEKKRIFKGVKHLTLTDEELEIITNWGFIVSTERPLSEEEKELYFKITNA
jgi:hypothetical protein